MFRKLRALFSRGRLDREMAEEIQAHLEELTERNIASGMSPEEARYAAMRAFGGVEQIKERARDERRFLWLEQLGQDLRHGWRQICRAPGFFAVAILTLAIGIGATTAIFSVVNGVLLQPLSFPKADRLVYIDETHPPDNRRSTVSWASYFQWQENADSFSNMAGFAPLMVGAMEVAGEVDRISALRVTTNFWIHFSCPHSLAAGSFRPKGRLGKKP